MKTAIYFDNQDGTYSHSGSYICEDGKTQQIGIHPNQPSLATAEQLAEANFQSTIQERPMYHKNGKNATVPATTTGGGFTKLRPEANRIGANAYSLTLSIKNTNTEQEGPMEVAIGDGCGGIQRVKGITADTLAKLTSNGRYGADSYQFLQRIIQRNDMHLETLVVNAKDENFFIEGIMELAVYNPTNNAVQTAPLDFNLQSSAQDFNLKTKRWNGLNIALSGFTALVVTLPPGAEISLTFYVKSFENGALMQAPSI